MIEIKKNILQQSIYMLTKTAPCPYIAERVEKRIATDITFNNSIYEELAINGFRRVENWMYRPACDNCNSCKSYRVDINNFKFTKSLKRVFNNLNHINIQIVKNIANQEHYCLFIKYQLYRHPSGSMSNMSEDDFISMIEISPVDTYLMEFRDNYKKLLGVMLFDKQKDDLSAVYSFFDPDLNKFGMGNFIIIKCLLYGNENNYKYLYLGYYIKEVSSMAYKIRFQPGQILEDGSWNDI